MPERPAPDPLDALRERLAATEAAASRLARETADSARGAAGQDIPRGGWEVPRSGAQASAELAALVGLIDSARAMLPEDIQHQLNELVRQLLVLIRGLIDWWLTRLDRDAPGRDVEVEEIPIL